MQKVIPLKRFGQNYLHDKNIIKKIIREINPEPDDLIVEIGPGRGALTEYIYEKTKNLIAVEIDKRVINGLKKNFPKIKLIQSDFMKTDISNFIKLSNKKIRIVGNIPYNLSASIIFKIIHESELINDAILMVQYEVAKRMTAIKGTKDYGILTVLLNYFAEVKLCFKVSPNAFYPKPNVNSAIIHIRIKSLQMKEKEVFIDIVKACFGHRRKTLKNSLSNSIFKEVDFSNSGIDLSRRAEQLDLKDFVNLAEYTRNQIA